ncbi:MAG: hypothetical protein IJO43_00285 [Bacilli bacterium]|nr:hypothetical protein [Bacilli bacterium]
MKNNSNDSGATKLLCYLGIFILLLFIILPPLFRVLFPVEEEIEEEKKQVIMNLTCEKTEDFVEYKVKTTINTNYVDGVINDSVFKYEIEIVEEFMENDDIEIEEYETLKRINNVDFEEEENLYTLKIDYKKFGYNDEPLLDEHRKNISDQMRFYTEEEHFECKTTQS